MGWSCRLHLCQLFTSTVCSRIVHPSRMILDKYPGLQLNKNSAECAIACAAYVDNVGIAGTDPKTIDSTSNAIQAEFKALGLELHEQCAASTTGEFIGLRYDNGFLSVKNKKLWRLKQAIQRA